MTFADQETSRYQGMPIGLLLFRYGTADDDVFAYTDCETPITFDGVTYQPEPNERDSIKINGTLDKSQLAVTFPQDSALSKFFDVYPPSQQVTLTIFQGHANNANFQMVWTGRVLGIKNDGDDAIFTCEPLSTSIRRLGLRRKYGYGCPYILYGPSCLADQAAATITVTPSNADQNLLTLASGWNGANDPSKYVSGFATWLTRTGRKEYRAIINADVTSVTLGADVFTLSPGVTVDLVLGCTHQMGGCILHNNIENYGGQPWIPTFNPVGVINNFF